MNNTKPNLKIFLESDDYRNLNKDIKIQIQELISYYAGEYYLAGNFDENQLFVDIYELLLK